MNRHEFARLPSTIKPDFQALKFCFRRTAVYHTVCLVPLYSINLNLKV